MHFTVIFISICTCLKNIASFMRKWYCISSWPNIDYNVQSIMLRKCRNYAEIFKLHSCVLCGSEAKSEQFKLFEMWVGYLFIYLQAQYFIKIIAWIANKVTKAKVERANFCILTVMRNSFYFSMPFCLNSTIKTQNT